MEKPSRQKVYLELGRKRVFAGAIDFPGWCRSGRDEQAALQALLDYAPRYARVLRATRLGFRAPTSVSAFMIVERHAGNATTDFGAPDATLTSDALPVDEAELRRLQRILTACWQAFDRAVQIAGNKELRKGPRGGGRDAAGIVRHVRESEIGYLSSLGWKLSPEQRDQPGSNVKEMRHTILEAIASSARGEIAPIGPRGGVRWTARYFVRRAAWHVLDHAWEIEDRLKNSGS